VGAIRFVTSRVQVPTVCAVPAFSHATVMELGKNIELATMADAANPANESRHCLPDPPIAN
jgi:hypothetical protein